MTAAPDSTTDLPRPPYDPELAAMLTIMAQSVPPTITPDMIEAMRGAPLPGPGVEELLADKPIRREDCTVAGFEGAEVVVTVFTRQDHVAGGPAVYHVHGGGMIIGDRFTGVEQVLGWVERYDAVVATVEYRLAPEFPDPVPVEDAYAGLVWFHENAERLGFDPDRIVVGGASAGGGLSAGVALMARDRQGPPLLAQLLMCPMLDDRNVTVSSRQFDGVGVWDRGSNDTGWDALLGDRRGTDAVSAYASPTRATDLSGLPPAFIDVGSAEVFRDEDVDYATRIWAAGGIAELHVWPGGFHGFQMFAGTVPIGREAMAAQQAWLDRILQHEAG